ncbi:hypothetical protein DP23_3186 [Ralstonia pickettii]|nr:hypothetical protein DP23_3186 [Ralstonia pickettii]
MLGKPRSRLWTKQDSAEVLPRQSLTRLLASLLKPTSQRVSHARLGQIVGICIEQQVVGERHKARRLVLSARVKAIGNGFPLADRLGPLFG